MELRLVAFDLDGVILDSEPIHAHSIDRVLLEYGITGFNAMCYVGMSSTEMWKQLIRIHALPATPRMLMERVIDFDEMWMLENNTPPTPGLIPLLDLLDAEGVEKCVTSSSERRFVRGALRFLGIEHRFAHIVTGTEVSRKKPWPDLYLRTLSLSGIDASHTAAIEDSSTGVCAAKTAGLYGIGFHNPGSGSQDLSQADCTVHRLSDAVAFLLP